MWIVVMRVRCWERWRAWRSVGEVGGLLVMPLLLVRGGVVVAVLVEDFGAGGRPLLDNDERMDVDMVVMIYLFIGEVLNCWNALAD